MPDSDQHDLGVLTLDEVASCLKVSPKTIHRMLRTNDIPAVKVGGQWRFLRDSVLAWLDERTMEVAENDLVNVITTAKTIVPITRLIGPDRIVLGIKSGSKRDVLLPMVEALADSGVKIDVEAYVSLLLKREDMVSTGIGPGVAFPHVRNPDESSVENPCIVLGVCPGGTDFESLDGNPTYVLAMCCSSSVVVHLRLLSKMALFMRDGDTVSQIRSVTTKRDVMTLLVKADCKLSESF
jgi:PTS system nitrogen regulatory IIA component